MFTFILSHLHYIVERFVIIFTSASTLMIDHKTNKQTFSFLSAAFLGNLWTD